MSVFIAKHIILAVNTGERIGGKNEYLMKYTHLDIKRHEVVKVEELESRIEMLNQDIEDYRCVYIYCMIIIE